MIATRLKGKVTEDRRLDVKVPRSMRPGEVEVILIRVRAPQEPRGSGRRQKAKVHPAAGLWRDRKDIGETPGFVLKLRRRLESRGDARR
jgi:hypothetical protein